MLDCPQWSRERLRSGLEAHRSLQPAMLNKPCKTLQFVEPSYTLFPLRLSSPAVPRHLSGPVSGMPRPAPGRLRLVAHCHWHVGEAPPTRSRLLACSMILRLH